MVLHLLPTRTGGAAENMAVDFLLLQRYPHATTPRFRHYAWRSPAFTFGYAQKIISVRELVAAAVRNTPGLPEPERIDLCRRPTGGGLVDHRADWTYALVIPRGHPLEELRATESYRAMHEAIAATLRDQGVDAITQPAEADERDAKAGVCFARAEIHDVIHATTRAKIAGAAQKRNKHGLLFQGSIWQPAIGRADFDWERFETSFTGRLAGVLNVAEENVPWPEFNEDELLGLTEQYGSPEWLEQR